MTGPAPIARYSRKAFLHMCGYSAGALSMFCAQPESAEARTSTAKRPATRSGSHAISCDLRDFVRWILEEFEPSVRLAGGAGRYGRQPGWSAPSLYGVADMACILHTIGSLNPTAAERAAWADAFELFQDPRTGWFLESEPRTLSPEHNTAFALAAMQLLDITPSFEVKMGAEQTDIRTYLNSLNWRSGVYADSHKGAGIGSIYALVRNLHSPGWFAEYFAACESLFDSNNGLMGRAKPALGDIDQIGGTFHYSFLYEFFSLQMPYPRERIDTVIRLRRPDGYWSPTNRLWLTLDAIYLMTRTLRYCPYRYEDVVSNVRNTMTILQRDVFSIAGRENIFSSSSGLHSLTAAISIAAEVQQFLGAEEVITEWPLKLVLDRRPFI